MSSTEKYKLRFFFEWGGGCLWSGDEAATRDFGYGPLDTADTKLPLSAETVRRCREVADWHDTSLNQAYPLDPGPWRQPECDRFNEAVKHLLGRIRAELGDRFEVNDQQPEIAEDPDLDVYLMDPNGFRRRTT
jgi:hypothetical protein